MKRCPTCDASYADEDVFCELDGARLEGEPAMVVSPAAASAPSVAEAAREAARERPTMAPISSCPVCHMPNSDDGDGYCSSCGHRLDARLTVSLLPPGATIGGCVVTTSRAPDDVLATRPSGPDVAIAIGDAAILADEAAAIRALARDPAVPKLLESGEDPRRGAFLLLEPPPSGATILADAAPSLDVRGALMLVRAVLELVESLEKSGFRWIPRQTDFYYQDRILLSRLRVARLEDGRADACCPIAIAGRALLPVPGLAGTPALFRLLAGPGLDAPHAMRDASAMRAELTAIHADLVRPRVEPRHVAGVCDGGLKRDHNEDAMAFATGETRGETWTVLVVCDGVSCSTHAEQASAVAAKTACDALAHFARSGDIAHEAATGAMHAAIRAAHVAICTAQIDHGTSEPPGTTIVAGLVYRRRLTVGWVGDSRAYWIGKGGSELLTRDHSWAQETVARGEMSEEDAMQQPLAHALTRCLGPLEGGDTDAAFSSVQPDVRSRDLPGAGHVVLCSDGLWNYFPDARTVAELVQQAGEGASSEAIALRLVNNALYRGGGDNVSVVVYAQSDSR